MALIALLRFGFVAVLVAAAAEARVASAGEDCTSEYRYGDATALFQDYATATARSRVQSDVELESDLKKPRAWRLLLNKKRADEGAAAAVRFGAAASAVAGQTMRKLATRTAASPPAQLTGAAERAEAKARSEAAADIQKAKAARLEVAAVVAPAGVAAGAAAAEKVSETKAASTSNSDAAKLRTAALQAEEADANLALKRAIKAESAAKTAALAANKATASAKKAANERANVRTKADAVLNKLAAEKDAAVVEARTRSAEHEEAKEAMTKADSDLAALEVRLAEAKRLVQETGEKVKLAKEEAGDKLKLKIHAESDYKKAVIVHGQATALVNRTAHEKVMFESMTEQTEEILVKAKKSAEYADVEEQSKIDALAKLVGGDNNATAAAAA